MAFKMSAPKYSICMCNYNMADTLERSLSSILNQIDDRFEVILVDDGSSDNSIGVVHTLMGEYPLLRLVELERDPGRKLGLTRNLSVQKARGEYALLQLDCDDVYGPHIIDFVEIFHQIERCLGRDFYLKGQKINMGKREFLLDHGPYRNLFRGEDRDMWARLAAVDAYVKLDHEPFVTRLPKVSTLRYTRALQHIWDQMKSDFRHGPSIGTYLQREMAKWPKRSPKSNLFRLLLTIPAYVAAKFMDPIEMPANMRVGKQFGRYRDKNRGTFSEWMKRCNRPPDYSMLSNDARRIFP